MYPALTIEKSLAVRDRKYALMPDTGMDVQTPGTVTPERYHLFWFQVIAGQGCWNDKGFFIQREK